MKTAVIWPLALAFLYLAPTPKKPPQAPAMSARVDSINLDLPADFPPVACDESVYLFSSGGRNQTMRAGESAPACNTQQLFPAVPPLCGGSGPFVLEKDGSLWQMGEGFPKAVESGLTGAVALGLAQNGRPVVLFKRQLRMEGGTRVDLDLDAEGFDILPVGFWVFGGSIAQLLDGAGKRLWSWEPKKFQPSHACFGGGRIFAGTAEGTLVALDARNGKVIFRYRTGGGIHSTPIISGDSVFFSSRDHLVRAVSCKGGQLVWQRRFKGRPDFGPVMTADGIWVAESAGKGLHLLSPKDGKTLWSWTAPGGSILQAPSFMDGGAAVLTWGENETPSLHIIRLQRAAAKGGA